MQTAIVILMSIVAVASAGGAFVTTPYVAGHTYLRTPALDTSYVESNRIGGNFAYRTVQGHAYRPLTTTYASYPAYPFAGFPTALFPNYVPYQPAYFEQQVPAGIVAGIAPAPFKPANFPAAFAPQQPAAFAPPPPMMPALNEGKQIDEDTVAVESAA